jgi:riboflavin synthase
MFTGIIEATGIIDQVQRDGENIAFWLRSPISDELIIDQSVTHDGACLTVDALSPGAHRVTAVAETIGKTNLGSWQEGGVVNLERSLQMNGRLDGHIVQGHVDTVAECISTTDKNGSWELRFRIPTSFASFIIEKGSICLNGVSLTIFDIANDAFSIAVIPYTYQHTNLKQVQPRTSVNIEFDMIGKYINRLQQLGGLNV